MLFLLFLDKPRANTGRTHFQTFLCPKITELSFVNLGLTLSSIDQNLYFMTEICRPVNSGPGCFSIRRLKVLVTLAIGTIFLPKFS